jgi:hypothetical protein
MTTALAAFSMFKKGGMGSKHELTTALNADTKQISTPDLAPSSAS